MDSNLTQRRQSLEEKIPDIKKTLDMVEYLQERRVCVIHLSLPNFLIVGQQEGKSASSGGEEEQDELEEEEEGPPKPIKTTFELNDTLYAEAELEDSGTVYLWLGVRSTVHQTYHTIDLDFRQMSCYHIKYPQPSLF